MIDNQSWNIGTYWLALRPFRRDHSVHFINDRTSSLSGFWGQVDAEGEHQFRTGEYASFANLGMPGWAKVSMAQVLSKPRFRGYETFGFIVEIVDKYWKCAS